MAVLASQHSTVAAAAEAAVAELVTTQHSGGSSFVNLPLLYPDGSFVTVKLDRSHTGVRVSDNGFAYRELEAIGASRSFAKTAAHVAEALDLQVDRRSVYADVPREQLVRAICDVSLASWQIADRVYARVADADEAEIEDYLRDRLPKVFGPALKAIDQKIKGPSTTEWEVSAIVERGGKMTVFHAVANHANSVFKTSAAFHDLVLLEKPPNLVSVVRSKPALGSKFNILAQAGKVIEEEQPDEVYWRAAA
jgi:hypothetical protein